MNFLVHIIPKQVSVILFINCSTMWKHWGGGTHPASRQWLQCWYKLPIKNFYFSGALVFRRKNIVLVNLDLPWYFDVRGKKTSGGFILNGFYCIVQLLFWPVVQNDCFSQPFTLFIIFSQSCITVIKLPLSALYPAMFEGGSKQLEGVSRSGITEAWILWNKNCTNRFQLSIYWKSCKCIKFLVFCFKSSICT